MKRTVFFGLLAIALVFSYCYWGLAPSVTREPIPAADGPKQVRDDRETAPKTTAVTPVVMATVPMHPISSDRQRIYDSSDVLATVKTIAASGTQDEKNWANALLGSCTRLFAKLPPAEEGATPLEAPAVPSSAERKAVATQQADALKVLSARCSGFKTISPEARAELKMKLTEGQAANKSVLGRLQEISDDHWNSSQAELLTNSLYSDDPIIARTAFFALLAAFDHAAPGGQDRQTAFTLAMGPRFVNFPLSEFESLQGCRSMGWCNGRWGEASNDPAPSPEVARLADEYRAAAQEHRDARSLLAIR